MSGSYADIPGTRMALDTDGTVAMYNTVAGQAGLWTDCTSSLSTSQKVDGSVFLTASTTALTVGFIFPEARTIKGIFWMGHNPGNSANFNSSIVYTSTDTVDGIGGTWVSQGSVGYFSSLNSTNPVPPFRSSIGTLNISNVKGIRIVGGGTGSTLNMYTVHIYGERSTGIDRLAFWHPTTDTELAGSTFDFGDYSRAAGASTPKQFRIKNLSATKNATGLVVTASDMTGSPFGSGKLQVSTDNSTWSSATAGFNLNANTISSIMYVRLNPDTTLVTQVRAGRLTTSTSSYA